MAINYNISNFHDILILKLIQKFEMVFTILLKFGKWAKLYEAEKTHLHIMNEWAKNMFFFSNYFYQISTPMKGKMLKDKILMNHLIYHKKVFLIKPDYFFLQKQYRKKFIK